MGLNETATHVKYVRIVKTIILLVLSLSGVSAHAYDTATIDGIVWRYYVADGQAILGCGPILREPAISESTSGELTIPAILGGCPVTSIGDYAFSRCSSLTSVTIPDSVTNIGYDAFDGCSGLASVLIPNSVTNIERCAFCACTNLMNVTIPDSVTSIGYLAFEGCHGLTSVTIPDSVTSIGYHAFESCDALTSVYITDIAKWCGISFRDEESNPLFYANDLYLNGSLVTDLTIPDTVASIGDYAFSGCSGLLSVTIPNSVTNMGHSAFTACTNITRATIPQCACTNSLSATFPNLSCIECIAIADGVTSIGNDAFALCTHLTSVTIPNSVTNIGPTAFWGCSSLASLAIPDGVTCVEAGTFCYCTNLTSVTIPNSVASIETCAFDGCSSLTSVTIPNRVTSIGYAAFRDCRSLTSMTIPNSVTSIGDCAFDDCSSLTSVMGGNGVASIGGSAFRYCKELENVTIGNGDTTIGSYAFEGCTNITSITISQSVCNYQLSYILYDSISRLENLIIADGVTYIGGSAFAGCSRLKSVTIPSSVTSIGNDAFYGCTNLSRVCISDVAAWCAVSFGLYYSDNPLAKAHDLYLNGALVTCLSIPDGVTGIEDSVFYGCTNLTSVSIPNSATSIGSYSFYGCSSLTSVTIPNSVTNIGKEAFCDCGGLTSVTIGNGVTSVGSLAFSGNTNLTSVTIGNGVTSIGSEAFYRCSGLTSVTIPNSVTNIGYGAFARCSGLTEISVPDGVLGIGGSAFSDCANLKSVTIGDGVGSLAASVFGGCSELVSLTIGDGVTNLERGILSSCRRLKELWLPKRINYSTSYLFGSSSSAPSGFAIVYYDKYSIYADRNSERLATVDGSETNVVLTATNDCRVTFGWKCSCEPMRKGRMYDYLSFSVDGERVGAICGETDWTNMTFKISGAGEHVLTFTYQKDESGSEGEDCGWVRNVRVVPAVTLSFLAGEATEGEPPEPMVRYEDDGKVRLPGCGTLALPKHWFAGWSDGETVYAADSRYPCDAEVMELTAVWTRKELSAPTIVAPEVFYDDTTTVMILAGLGENIRYTVDGTAPNGESTLYTGPFTIGDTTTIRAIKVRDDYFDSPEASLIVVKHYMTFGDAVNAPRLTFTPTDGTGWRRVADESPDGYALRSGAIGHSATSRLETVVVGEGVIAFKCRVEGEVFKGDVYDGLAFCIDGVQKGALMGNEDWMTCSFAVEGSGSHTLSWLYVKDEEGDGEGEDCAWIDEVTWTPGEGTDQIPSLPSNSSAATVNATVDGIGFADAAVKAAIGGSAAEYNAFKTWADGVKGATGSALAGEAAVVASPCAAAAFLLGSERLFANEPTVEIVRLEIGTGAALAGGGGSAATQMTVAVAVRDGTRTVSVDSAKVAAMIEATSDLGDWSGAAKLTPTVTSSNTDSSGKMTFVVTPGDGAAGKAFLRIKR